MSDDAGNPRAPQPGDPTEMVLSLTGQDLQVLFGALGELPAKFSRPLLDKIEAQRDAQVLAARRARMAAAEERRAQKAKKHAAQATRKNGDTAPAA